MKKLTSSKTALRLLAAITIVAFSLTGCSTDNDPQTEGNHRPDKDSKHVLTYNLSLGGDYVDEFEEPLARANDAASYVGINVTRKATGSSESENYAYGVFTIKNNIQIDLIGGYTYDFEATVLTNHTDDLKILSSSYPEPFRILQDPNYNDDDYKFLYPMDNANKFIYNFSNLDNPTKTSLCELGSGRARVSLNHDNYDYPSCQFPRVDRYYGVTRGFNPDNTNPSSGANIEIELAYKCFGLKIDASDIPAGTQLSWRDISPGRSDEGRVSQLLRFPYNLRLSPESLETKEWEDIYSLYNLKGDDSETFTLRFTWNRGGTTETFDQTFQVRAKYKKVLKIIINGSSTTTSRGNITIKEQANDLSDDALTITHNSQ